MKVTKTYSFDVDMIDQLSKEPNASAVINQLLQEHYSSTRENINKKRAELKKKLELVDREDDKLIEIEAKTEAEQALYIKKEQLKLQREKEFIQIKDELTEKSKKEGWSFEKYRKHAISLRKKYGMR